MHSVTVNAQRDDKHKKITTPVTGRTVRSTGTQTGFHSTAFILIYQ
jgi:hypothetical protein